jgi:hydroxymethylglutaryl-CoA reductase (NADPH)
MANTSHRVHHYLADLLRDHTQEEWLARLAPHNDDPAAPVPRSRRETPESVDRRWQLLQAAPETRAALADPQTLADLGAYSGNIENCIGTVKIPVGLAGPLRVNGLNAKGDFYVPLATTEAALVASYCRGAQLISQAGGCTAVVLNEGVSRAPGYAFTDLRDAGAFVAWAMTQLDVFRAKAEATTRHGKLTDMRITVEGNHVYLNFEYTTGDAAGQNMVTLATQAVCDYIAEASPVKPRYHFLEANLSGDKKASAQSFLQVRGKKVSAEVRLPAELVRQVLRTTPERMVQYWQMSALGGVLSGTLGVQGHYANGIAALYIACGQDAACVAESAVGVTRFELDEAGGLYAAVTLPNLIVGTVGGGTGLPSQRACLSILGLAGTGKAAALAEVCAALCLAGELSIIGALCAGDFSRAHRVLARDRAAKRTAEAKPHG